MRIDTFEMERMQSIHWHRVEYDLSESGVTPLTIAELLGEMQIADRDKFLAEASNPELLAMLGLEDKGIEGYLFPDTYHFTPSTPERDIILAMVEQFRKASDPILTEHQATARVTARVTAVTERDLDLAERQAEGVVAVAVRPYERSEDETGLAATVGWYLDNRDWTARIVTGAYRDWVSKRYGARA